MTMISQANIEKHLNNLNDFDTINKLINPSKCEISYLGKKYVVLTGANGTDVYLEFEKILEKVNASLIHSHFFSTEEKEQGKILENTLKRLNRTFVDQTQKVNVLTRGLICNSTIKSIPFSRLDKWSLPEFEKDFEGMWPVIAFDKISELCDPILYNRPTDTEIATTKDIVRNAFTFSTESPPKKSLLNNKVLAAVGLIASASMYYFQTYVCPGSQQKVDACLKLPTNNEGLIFLDNGNVAQTITASVLMLPWSISVLMLPWSILDALINPKCAIEKNDLTSQCENPITLSKIVVGISVAIIAKRLLNHPKLWSTKKTLLQSRNTGVLGMKEETVKTRSYFLGLIPSPFTNIEKRVKE
ncbi:MAG: hypothetical protein K1060chlam5_00508 [Candidatus Anoxychlamydiales bacterium]|nr:hypothetical protein [Candidatus Anoxychlamydiales bacterium]